MCAARADQHSTPFRAAALPILLLFLFTPLILFSRSATVGGTGIIPASAIDPVFRRALLASLLHGGGTALATGVIGGLMAIVVALGRFRSRRVLNVLWRAMLVVSPMIPAGGWLLAVRGHADGLGKIVRGPIGAILASTAMFLPIVMIAVESAIRAAGRGAAESAFQTRGRSGLYRWAIRVTWPSAVGAALIAGALAIGDPVACEIFGVRGAASEVLVSLAARYDFHEASALCLVLSWLVTLVILPGLWPTSMRLVRATMPGDSSEGEAFRVRPTTAAVTGVWIATLLLLGPPLAGIFAYAFPSAPWDRAFETIVRTSGATITFAGGGALAAVALGFALALVVGRSRAARMAVTPIAIAVLALPPAAGAFGMRALVDLCPIAIADVFDRGGTLAFAIAFRLWPIAFVLIARRMSEMPTSFAEAAKIAAISPLRYGVRILCVQLRRVLMASWAIIFLLGASDVSSALLVGPPGRPTTLQSIYTTIANARDAHAAALYFLWFATAAAFWGIVEVWELGTRRRA